MDFLQAKDQGLLYWFQGHHRPDLDHWAQRMTELGDLEVSVVVVLLTALVYLAGRQLRGAAILIAIALLGVVISQGIKQTVKRTRPDVATRIGHLPRSHSFPSGHAFLSMTIYGSITFTAARRLRWLFQRLLAVAFGVGLAIIVGLTRPYLGVHWPSDVLAGWIGGLACALLALWLDRRWGERISPGVQEMLRPPSQ